MARAIWSGRRITLTCERPGPRASVVRLVDPLGLVLKTDNWYLVAARDGQVRTYRVSRIVTCELREEPVRRPGAPTHLAVESAIRAEGRLDVALPMEADHVAVAQLLAVPDVEVIEPVDLRRTLAVRAEAIARRNQA